MTDLVSFDSLPLGARFHYPGTKEVWVKIENSGEGVIAEWNGPILNYVGQGIFSFADSPEERAAGRVELADEPIARPLAEYHEDHGPVVWWKFPVNEPSWIGQPTDDGWPGYHTHWTPHPSPPRVNTSTERPEVPQKGE